MGRPKKPPTKVVGFRIPLDKEDVFKKNVYDVMSQLLTVNGKVIAVNGKWTDDDINFFMVFFQRNKNNLHITKIDREFFQNIVKRAKEV